MVNYDPFSEDVIHGDKYAIYKQLRDESPVYHFERYDAYVLSRFDDVWEACQSDAYSSAKGTTTAHLLTKIQPVQKSLNLMDPPDHSSLRALVRKQFMPRRVRELEPKIHGFVKKLLDEMVEKAGDGEIDFVKHFAQPLATQVGLAVIGLPPEDGALLHDWVARFFGREPGHDGMTEDGVAAMMELDAYFQKISAEHRKKPPATPDSISVIQGWQAPDGSSPDDAEIAANLQLLLIGGTDTLPKVLANLMLRLHQNPEQRSMVAKDPSLVLPAFNEAVRLDMPTQNMARLLTRDVELHGQTMPAGRPVLWLYASANRDEREFTDPDLYDVKRGAQRSLSFSHGTHACIGLHVARKEGQLALQEILSRFPNFEVNEAGAERYGTEFVQGFATLPVRFRA